MGGPSAVDDVVVRGIEWSPMTWMGLIAVSVVAVVTISLIVCRARSRRRPVETGAGTPDVAVAGAGGPTSTSSVPSPSDGWRRGERPVTERLAEVRRLQGAGLITAEQADRRVREILSEV